MTVWTDFDHFQDFTELSADHLPKWESLTEFMKLFIGFDIGMEFSSGYSFTAHILPSQVAKWQAGSTGLVANIEQTLRRQLDAAGLRGVPFCYVIETRSRSGKLITRPHLHGYCILDDPSDAGRFDRALTDALHPYVPLLGTRRPVKLEPSYDRGAEEFIGRIHWVRYFTKNVDQWEAILGKRRLYMSRSLQRMVRDAWGIRREE
jgi:hypothetical protein